MSVLERILLVYILMNLLFECQVNDIFLSLEYSVEFEIKKNFHLKSGCNFKYLQWHSR